jgi:hypothetical protein
MIIKGNKRFSRVCDKCGELYRPKTEYSAVCPTCTAKSKKKGYYKMLDTQRNPPVKQIKRIRLKIVKFKEAKPNGKLR